jgi:hypothetical protein
MKWVKIKLHSFIISKLNGDEQSASCSGHFTQENKAPLPIIEEAR